MPGKYPFLRFDMFKGNEMISQHSQQQQKLYTDQPQHWNLLPIMRRGCEPTKTVWSDWIMDTKSPLGVWQQDVGTRSFGCCGLQGGASVALACYGTSCGCSIGVWSGRPGHVPRAILEHFCSAAGSIVPVRSERGWGTCESSIHMTAWTWGFPADNLHCDHMISVIHFICQWF